MKNGRIDIASIRREQIIDAAIAGIAEQGLQHLSLSEIESRAGMSRGQLTYYFKTKEEIFLAVFDRLLLLMHQRHGDPDQGPCANLSWLEFFQHLLGVVMRQPPEDPAFPALQYTFLSQITHREDFRERLAGLYELWRTKGTEHLQHDLDGRPPVRTVSPRAIATLMQAILHGLAMQTAADPGAIDAREMTSLCLDMLGTYLWSTEPEIRPGAAHPPSPGVAHERHEQ